MSALTKLIERLVKEYGPEVVDTARRILGNEAEPSASAGPQILRPLVLANVRLGTWLLVGQTQVAAFSNSRGGQWFPDTEAFPLRGMGGRVSADRCFTRSNLAVR